MTAFKLHEIIEKSSLENEGFTHIRDFGKSYSVYEKIPDGYFMEKHSNSQFKILQHYHIAPTQRGET